MVFGVGDVGNIVLRDRQMLSQDGLIIVVLNLSQETGGLISDPDIISRGFVYVRENEELLQTLKELVKVEINDLEEKEWAKVWAIDHEMLSNELPVILTDEPIMEKAPLLSSPILEERSMRAVELEFLKLFTEPVVYPSLR